MKQKLISVSLALALGLSLAACGSKPAPSGAETPAGELGTLSGPVELQFWHSISNQNHLKVLEGLVEEFNETIGAEKGITVVPTFNGSSSELYSSVVGAIKAGSAPDVTLALRPYVADYLQTDYVVNLEPYITDPNVGMTDYEDIFEGLREANSSYAKEGIYSLPIHSYSEVLYYNKTFFAEHGLLGRAGGNLPRHPRHYRRARLWLGQPGRQLYDPAAPKRRPLHRPERQSVLCHRGQRHYPEGASDVAG